MRRRQSTPRQWLIVRNSLSRDEFAVARRLPRGSGILLLTKLVPAKQRRLRQVARERRLEIVVEERGAAARVHDGRELRAALLARTPLVLLSPVYSTASHPDWLPLPRMRAAALARLADRRLIALGGMNQARYAKVAQLGFIGWAGISAFRT